MIVVERGQTKVLEKRHSWSKACRLFGCDGFEGRLKWVLFVKCFHRTRHAEVGSIDAFSMERCRRRFFQVL